MFLSYPSDFVKMDWLEAARIIRGAHASRRQSPADFVKGFKKWMGLRTQVSTIQTSTCDLLVTCV